MRLLALVTAVLVGACVAPAAAQSDCSITAQAHFVPDRQVHVEGRGFQNADAVTVGGTWPDGSAIDIPLRAEASGTFALELRGTNDGTYTITAKGLTCTAPAVTLTLTTPKPTAKPTPRPTLPPRPVVTMPPTDTE